MVQILRDPALGQIVAIFALLLGFFLWKLTPQHKRLSYHFRRSSELVRIMNTTLADRVVTLLDGNPVKRLATVQVSIYNHGNVPITAGDFVEPIVLAFDPEIKVLVNSVQDVFPSSLTVELLARRDGSTFEVTPLLLNAGDAFTLEFVLDGAERPSKNLPTMSARIVGVSKFAPINAHPRRRTNMLHPRGRLRVAAIVLLFIHLSVSTYYLATIRL